MAGDFDAELAQLKKRRLYGLIGFGIALVLMIVVLMIADALRLPPFLAMPVILMGILSGAGAISSKCPRCGKPFFGMPIRGFWGRSCWHCKLGRPGDDGAALPPPMPDAGERDQSSSE